MQEMGCCLVLIVVVQYGQNMTVAGGNLYPHVNTHGCVYGNIYHTHGCVYGIKWFREGCTLKINPTGE